MSKEHTENLLPPTSLEGSLSSGLDLAAFPILREGAGFDQSRNGGELRTVTGDVLDFTAGVERDPQQLFDCLRLTTMRYLDEGYIEVEDLDEDGVYRDEYVERSLYFSIRDVMSERLVCTSRQIPCTEEGFSSLPIFKGMTIRGNVQRQLKMYDPKKAVEISALAEEIGAMDAAPVEIYKGMWQESIYKGHELWFLAADSRLFETLKTLFGSSVDQIGPDKNYMGSITVPAALSPRGILRGLPQEVCYLAEYHPDDSTLATKKGVVDYFTNDLDTAYLSDNELALIRRVSELDI